MSSLIEHFLTWMKKLGESVTASDESQQVDWQHIDEVRGRLAKMRRKSQASVKPISDTYMTDVDRENTSLGGIIPMSRRQNNKSGVTHWSGEMANPMEAQLRDSFYSGNVNNKTFSDSDWQYKQSSQSRPGSIPAIAPALDLQHSIAGFLPDFGGAPVDEQSNAGNRLPEISFAPEASAAEVIDVAPPVLTNHAYFDSIAESSGEAQRYSYATEASDDSQQAASAPDFGEITGEFELPMQAYPYATETAGGTNATEEAAPATYYDEYSPEELALLAHIRLQAGLALSSSGDSVDAHNAFAADPAQSSLNLN